jgi:LysM repeat protein
MRRVLLTMLLLILLAVGWVPGRAARASFQPSNLLQNPGFEGSFYAWSGMNEVQVAHGWTPWWRTRSESDPPAYYFKPEYKQANGYVFPNRIHGGASAQQWFTFHATHQAGMYQQVFGVTPGAHYRFTVWAQVWSSSEDDSAVSKTPAYPNLQVGIDPTGNWNPWAGTVIWSGTYAFYDSWGQLAVEAVAQKDVITVFMRSEPNFPVKHNDFYWDDAALVAVGPGVPAPFVPTATSPPPIVTSAGPPAPTATCAPAPSDWVAYFVQRGDTLYSLSRRSGTTVDRIMTANCLRLTAIQVGQSLLLPRQPDTPTPLPPTATAKPVVTPTAAASATLTQTPTEALTETPTKAPIETPTERPTTTARPTATTTPTKLPPTIPPPATPTPGSPTPPTTSTPSGAGTRPCGTIALGAGIVMLAGVFRFRRRGQPLDG